MNAICGLISFDKTFDLYLLKKMELFLHGSTTQINANNTMILSITDGDFCEYIYENIHIMCVITGNVKEIPCASIKQTDAIFRLYIKHGKSFIEHISGSYTIIIYDFNKREFMFFEDESGSIPLFYSINNDTLYFSTSINSLFEIPENKKIFSFMSINKMFTLVPALNFGETVYDNIFFLPAGHHLIYNREQLKICEQTHLNTVFNTCTFENYTIADTGNPYYIADIKLSPSPVINPVILESAKRQRKFTNKMLIDLFFLNEQNYSFETPFILSTDTSTLLSVIKDELKEFIIFSDYRNKCLYDEITNMDFFCYTDKKDIERCEIIFLNKRMLIPQIVCDIFSFLSFFNIKNESFLNSPQTINYIISMSRRKTLKEILSEIFMTDIVFEHHNTFSSIFNSELKNMCLCSNLKIFKIFDRFKLYEKAGKIEHRLAMYILQINYLLEKKDITLEF